MGSEDLNLRGLGNGDGQQINSFGNKPNSKYSPVMHASYMASRIEDGASILLGEVVMPACDASLGVGTPK